jgi:hypothetical protein
VSAIWLALGSVLVWLLGQYWDPLCALAIAVSPIPAVWPNLLTWQLLFVLGMCLAVLPPQSALAEWSRRRGVVAASFGLAVLCFAARHHVLELPPAILALFSKANLAPLRVFNVLLLVQLGARLMAWFPLQARVAWLALLGRHSLEVFSFHILLAYAVPPLFGAPALSDSGLVLLTAACTLAAFTIMNKWQPFITTTEAGLLYCSEPVFTALLALFLPAWFSLWGGLDYLNETLGVNLLVGGGLITLANVLIQMKPRNVAASA